MMNRDGSVFLPVTLADLQKPDQLYVSMGAKTVVGLPFKDIACADSVYLTEIPSKDDKEARRTIKRLQDVAVGMIGDYDALVENPITNSVALITMERLAELGELPPLPQGSIRYAIKINGVESEETYELMKKLISGSRQLITTLILETSNQVSRVHAQRRAFQMLHNIDSDLPVILSLPLTPSNKDELILRAGTEAGALLVDGLGDGVMLEAVNDRTRSNFPLELIKNTAFSLLQGARMRSVKTDFVSCPSCGRTLFDLQIVTEQIKEKTGHLPGVTVAIMGCIVNGPGEMADADFGYVGGAPGKVDLYVGKEVMKRGIPNEQACDALVDLIKEYGRWTDKETSEEIEVKEDVNA